MKWIRQYCGRYKANTILYTDRQGETSIPLSTSLSRRYNNHSRGAYSGAWNYCMLFNNPNSHRTVKHRQRCCLKRVIKLISHMLFQNTAASLCLEMLCSVPEWQFSSTVVKRKQQGRRNIVQWNQTGNIWQIGQNKAPTIIPREIYC